MSKEKHGRIDIRSPRHAEEVRQGIQLFEEKGIVTLWSDASHCSDTNLAAVAIVRVDSGQLLVKKPVRAKRSTAAEAEALDMALGIARRLIRDHGVDAGGRIRKVRVHFDVVKLERRHKKEAGIELVRRGRDFNLAHKHAYAALQKRRARGSNPRTD